MKKLCEGLNELGRDEARRIYDQRIADARKTRKESGCDYAGYQEPADSDWLDSMQQEDFEWLMGGPEDAGVDDYD